MRRAANGLAVLILGGALLGSPAAAQAGGIPSNFKRHENRYWTWYAPRGWVASYGANGIDVTSPVGDDYAGYGVGGVICPNTAAQYFSGYSAFLRNSNSLYPKRLQSARYTRASRITNPYGASYFRQRLKWQGRRANGVPVRGEVVLDIFAAGAGACGQRTQIRSAPSQGFARTVRILRAIQRLFFYHPQ